jgi:hypothetical protein
MLKTFLIKTFFVIIYFSANLLSEFNNYFGRPREKPIILSNNGTVTIWQNPFMTRFTTISTTWPTPTTTTTKVRTLRPRTESRILKYIK